jgi:predicted AAA+ superfamily ATPase
MLQVTEAEVKNRLAFDNPWWAEKAVPKRFRDWPRRAYLDGLYAMMAESKVRRAVVLLGPRRVGKTVMLQQSIQRLIDKGTAPRAILYVSVDTPVYTGLPLARLLQLFMEVHGHGRADRLFVIYDEIQYHKDWELHLKSLVDSYPEIRFVASGSAAAALRMKSNESGAGRFTDFLLPPLTFAEFRQFAKRGALERFTDTSREAIEALNRDFVDYLNFGGFPEAVMDESVRRSMDRYIASDIIDKVLLRDLPSLYGVSDTTELNRLFTILAYNTGSEVNLEGLSQASGVAKNTLRKYIEYLEAAFLIHRLYRVDENARRFKRATHFKVFLTNPCIRAALFGAVGPDDEAMGRMSETGYVSQVAHIEAAERLFYARWPKGEVDFVALDPASQRPYGAMETKWSDRAAERPEQELSGLIDFCTRNKIERSFVATCSAIRTVTIGKLRLVMRPVAAICQDIDYDYIARPLAKGLHPRTLIPFAAIPLADEPSD